MSKSKRDTFESLRQLYLANGRRFVNLSLKDGFVDWCAEGFYSICDERTQDGRKIALMDKFNRKTAVIPNEMAAGYTPKFTNGDIRDNFSWTEATLHFGKSEDHIQLFQFFPKVRRALTRKLSEEPGATSRLAIEDKHGGDQIDSTRANKSQTKSSQSDGKGLRKATPVGQKPRAGIFLVGAAQGQGCEEGGGGEPRRNSPNSQRPIRAMFPRWRGPRLSRQRAPGLQRPRPQRPPPENKLSRPSCRRRPTLAARNAMVRTRGGGGRGDPGGGRRG